MRIGEIERVEERVPLLVPRLVPTTPERPRPPVPPTRQPVPAEELS